MKRIINLITGINYSPKYIIRAIVLIAIWYYWATFDLVEWKRQHILSEAKADRETLSGSIEEKKQELQEELKALDVTLYCIKQNSQTGTIVDCDTLKSRDVKIEVKSELGNANLPSENSNKKNKWDRLNSLICEVWQINGNISPLCNNISLTKELYRISEDRWVDFMLMLWIAYAESHIGRNYAKWCDKSYNNMWGIKRAIDWEWNKKKDQDIPDKNWCWIYKFNSLQKYWASKANSLYHWYYKKNCTTISCIAKYYVKGDWLRKPAYEARVNVFAEFNF